MVRLARSKANRSLVFRPDGLLGAVSDTVQTQPYAGRDNRGCLGVAVLKHRVTCPNVTPTLLVAARDCVADATMQDAL